MSAKGLLVKRMIVLSLVLLSQFVEARTVYDRFTVVTSKRGREFENDCSVSGVALKASGFKGELPTGYCSAGITAQHCIERILESKWTWLAAGGTVQRCLGDSALGAEIPLTNSFGRKTLNAIAVQPKLTTENETLSDIALLLLPCGVEFSQQSPLVEDLDALLENFEIYTPIHLADKERKSVTARPNSVSADEAKGSFEDLVAVGGDSGSPVMVGKELAGIVTSVGEYSTKEDPKKRIPFLRAHFGIKPLDPKNKPGQFSPRRDFLSLLDGLACKETTLPKAK